MRKIPLAYALEGMYLGRTIIDSEGHVMLRAGVCLDEYYINRLYDIRVNYVYIIDPDFEDMDDEDIISEETRIKTVKLVKQSFNNLQQERKLNTVALRTVVNNILDEILDNNNVLMTITDIATLDNVIFYHLVSVCTLSIMTGITLGYNDTRLKELGIGALLHDIGKSKIDSDIIKRTGNLNEEEYAELCRHPELGYQIIRQYGDLSLLSAHIAYQHHERWDGKGYPRQLAGNDIHEYGRIVAVANTYDNLMTEQPNRPPYQVNQAIKLLKHMSGIYFDPRIVTAVIANIATYPVGCFIRLNTGEIGIVTENNPLNPQRPLIRIVVDNLMRRVKQPYEIDLSQMSTVFPAEVLSERDLNMLLPRTPGV